MVDIFDVDEVLPQTQCTLCGYGGCLPYAEAMVNNGAAINLCPPGGVETLRKLSDLFGIDATPYVDEMKRKAKPPLLAVIREEECIGCTKCIQACPVDAILGSAKNMHTVIAKECTGCELCIPPCPVDCIDLVSLDESKFQPAPDQYRNRHQAKQVRMSKKKQPRIEKLSAIDKKEYLQAALKRFAAKSGKA